MEQYNFEKIEKKWQKYWEDNKTFSVTEDINKKKFYPLVEFPYPSGVGLHVGHPRPFTAMDAVARQKRMQGFNVLYPIGYDAFGLPTENYAIKTGRQPAEVTTENISNFERQLKMLGYSFDWDRKVNTTDPKYYKWTQWIFLQLFKHGLAYKKNMPINWCLSCKIGLANEEIVDGRCERCGGEVEKRDKEQWMLAITKYADSLLQGLDDVDYINRAKVQQQNWIGKSEGAKVQFKIKNSKEILEVFTTRPDTLFGATYMVVSPEHEMIENNKEKIENIDEVNKYIKKARLKSDLERTELQKDKTGMELKGIKAINPVNNEEIPVYVADYVLSTYGTGAIMAVPAHDQRDFEFATKYNIEIRQVVAPLLENSFGKDKPQADKETVKRKNVFVILKHWKDDSYYCLDWGKHKWTSFVIGGVKEGETWEQGAVREMVEESGYKNIKKIEKVGHKTFNHFYAAHKGVNRFADSECYLIELENSERKNNNNIDTINHTGQWIAKEKVSSYINLKNHLYYWEQYINGSQASTEDGININSDFLDGLKTHDAKEKMIAWLLQKKVGQKETNFKLRDWVFSRQRYWGEPIPLVNCEKCGWVPIPESELPLELPKVEKYEPTDTGESPLIQIEDWVNTTCPKCGEKAKRETDTMPNWAGSSWYFLRYCDPNNDKELASIKNLNYWGPVDWYNGGMEHTVLHLLYSRFWNHFLYDIGLVPFKEPYKKRTSHGMILASDGEKMSKSRGNVITPDDMIKKFGCDTFRTYIMFMGPFDQTVVWDTNGLVGVKRFIERVWALQDRIVENNDELIGIYHRTIKKVSEDIENMHFNTAVSSMMEFVNQVYKTKGITKEQYKTLVQLLSPFACHICEELWEILGNSNTISSSEWPKHDDKLIIEDSIKIAIQINGKVRDEIEIPIGTEEEIVKKQVLSQEKVIKWLENKKPKKVIYVKDKLVSIVV